MNALRITPLDGVIIGGYFVLTIALGLWFGRKKIRSAEALFLADREATWPMIGASMFSANISSQQFVGQAGLDSRSLVPAMACEGSGRDLACSVYMDGQRMATDGRWKLIVYRVGGNERVQLFDLATDPDECHDLAGEPGSATCIAALRARLQAWQSEAGDRWFGSVQSASV